MFVNLMQKGLLKMRLIGFLNLRVYMQRKIHQWFDRYAFYLGGDQPLVSWPERFRSCAGALVGLTSVFTVAKLLGEMSGINEWLMASLGASALLVFALPGSPMAQPWGVIAGNTISALVGITILQWMSELLLTLPMAVSMSIMAMFILRCLHPPAAAVALIVVLGNCTLSLCPFPSDD